MLCYCTMYNCILTCSNILRLCDQGHMTESQKTNHSELLGQQMENPHFQADLSSEGGEVVFIIRSRNSVCHQVYCPFPVPAALILPQSRGQEVISGKENLVIQAPSYCACDHGCPAASLLCITMVPCIK